MSRLVVGVRGRAVLGAHVRALAVQRRRIVDVEKDVQQLAQRDGLRVVSNPHRLQLRRRVPDPGRRASLPAVEGCASLSIDRASFAYRSD